MDEMELKRVGSKQLVNDKALDHMIDEKVEHLVEHDESDPGAVSAVLLFNALYLSIYLVHICIHNLFGGKCVQ